MNRQRGGFVIGLIAGLLVGLALALGVALYVTRAPVPFVNKVPQRTTEQDAAEAERNRTWDPNAPLVGKPVPRPALPVQAASPAPASQATGTPPRDPAAILAGAPAPAPAGSAPRRSAKTEADPFIYFVQAGAFQHSEEAEQQRARLAMLGLESKLVEREQAGRTVFRVRIGPFDAQAEADAAKDKLVASGVEAVLVRINRPTQ